MLNKDNVSDTVSRNLLKIGSMKNIYKLVPHKFNKNLKCVLDAPSEKRVIIFLTE